MIIFIISSNRHYYYLLSQLTRLNAFYLPSLSNCIIMVDNLHPTRTQVGVHSHVCRATIEILFLEPNLRRPSPVTRTFNPCHIQSSGFINGQSSKCIACLFTHGYMSLSSEYLVADWYRSFTNIHIFNS